MWKTYQVYAVYGGKDSDTYLTQGTIDEIAKWLGVSKNTAYFYTTRTWRSKKHQIEVIKMKGVTETKWI